MKEKSLPSRILAGAGLALMRGSAGAGRGIAGSILRNPKPTLYATTFLVAFSFVAANALWYQPGGHPSPFLATRDARDPNAIAGYRPFERSQPDNVTTFRIERAPAGGGAPVVRAAPDQAPQQQSQQMPQPQQMAAQPAVPQDDIRSIIDGQAANPVVAPSAEADRAMVAGIQRALSARGLYDGADDGLMGPRTEAAILFFEETTGLPQRGVPTPELLAVLQQPSRQAAPQPASAMPMPVPRQAPRETAPVRSASRAAAQPTVQPVVQQVRASARNEDPITAAIRSSERQPGMTPPADIPGSRSRAPAASASRDPIPSTQMVLQIQKGLSNIAYTDVEVDGVAGSQTKAAIRRFQKHYRLPETGEPDAVVLKKLKAIGAL